MDLIEFLTLARGGGSSPEASARVHTATIYGPGKVCRRRRRFSRKTYNFAHNLRFVRVSARCSTTSKNYAFKRNRFFAF